MPKDNKTTRRTSPVTPPQRNPLTVAISMKPNKWIREEAHARGWQLTPLWQCRSQLPEGVKPRGVLTQELPDHEDIQSLRKARVPVVRMGSLPHPEDAEVPAVIPDQVGMGKMAADHFAERGFRHTAYLGFEPWGGSQGMFEAFSIHSEKRGMNWHLYQLLKNADEASSERHKRQASEFINWLLELPKPIGLLTGGVTFGAIQMTWIQEAGLSIPDDVAILVRGNMQNICESLSPTLSSIEEDDEERARTACDLLDRMMTGAPYPTETVLIPPAGITLRESTDVLLLPD